MKVLKEEAADGTINGYLIECPGCGHGHFYDKRWSFNGNFDKPTFTPSYLTRSGHYLPEHKGDCWCDYNRKHSDNKAPYECGICHSFLTDGKLQFLDDCTHSLKGQTIEIQDII